MKTQMIRANRHKKIDDNLQSYECLGLLLPCYSFIAIPLCIGIGGVFLITSSPAECFWTLLPLKSLSLAYFGFCAALARSTLGFCQKNLNHLRKAKVLLLLIGLFIFLHMSIMALLSMRNLGECIRQEFEGNWIMWLSGPCFLSLFAIAYVWNSSLIRSVVLLNQGKESTDEDKENQLLAKA